jgi:hypothetical protein
VTVSAQVFDSQGNALTNLTATSALGVNYLAAGGPTIPEAGTLSMLAVGLLALVESRFIPPVKVLTGEFANTTRLGVTTTEMRVLFHECRQLIPCRQDGQQERRDCTEEQS